MMLISMCKCVLLIAVVLAVRSTDAKIVGFDTCGSFITPIGKVLQIDITPCDTDPCIFHPGDNVTAKITFIPEEAVRKGLLEMMVIFAGGEMLPWPVENPLACEGHKLSCPLKPNKPVTAVMKSGILKIPGSYKVVGQVSMTETTLQNYVFCFRIPIQVTY